MVDDGGQAGTGLWAAALLNVTALGKPSLQLSTEVHQDSRAHPGNLMSMSMLGQDLGEGFRRGEPHVRHLTGHQLHL